VVVSLVSTPLATVGFGPLSPPLPTLSSRPVAIRSQQSQQCTDASAAFRNRCTPCLLSETDNRVRLIPDIIIYYIIVLCLFIDNTFYVFVTVSEKKKDQYVFLSRNNDIIITLEAKIIILNL